MVQKPHDTQADTQSLPFPVRQAPVCILGMGRSGTSLITRILNLLGAYLGPVDHLNQPAQENPKGFWEHFPLMWLNEELLVRLGISGHEPLRLAPGWETAPHLADLRWKAWATLATDFAEADFWAWKDPRNCLTLPFWQRILPPMRYVICIRNPLDVARSVQRRFGVPLEVGVRLWLNHTTAALEHTTRQPRMLISFEDVMRDWESQLFRLAQFVGRLSWSRRMDVRDSVRAFVDPELYHHRSCLVDVISAPAVGLPAKAFYLLLRSWLEPGREQIDGDAELEEVLRISASAVAQLGRAEPNFPSGRRALLAWKPPDSG